MTADERLEALLNRAGQTISDLPRKGTEASEPYPLAACPKANGAAWDWYLDIGGDMDDYDSTRTKLVLKLYILHLTDIIDRMEAALENALNLIDRNVHIVSNTDIPEGVTDKQFAASVDAIYESFEKYRAGLEPWEDWRADE